MTPKALTQIWKKKNSTWMIPKGFSPLQKKLLLQAQKQVQGYQNLVWFSSSGSTSSGIKFFGMEKKALKCSALSVSKYFQLKKTDIWFNPLPIEHVGGFCTWLRCHLKGATWINGSNQKWSPKKFHQLLGQKKVTITSLVPTQVYDLVSNDLPCPSSLRAVLVGGGRLNSDLKKQAQDLGWPLYTSYGMTEMGSTVAICESKSEQALTLSHIQEIHTTKGQTFIKSPASAKFELRVSNDEEFSLELKTRDSMMLIDDQLRWNSKTKVLKVLGRKSRVIKVKGELISLDAMENQLQKWMSKENLKSDFILHSMTNKRDENEMILIVEGMSGFLRWHQLLKKFNLKASGLQKISRLHFVKKFSRTSLGKTKLFPSAPTSF